MLTRLPGEAIDDLEKMLKRRTPHIDITRRIQQKAYFKALTERGVELRLLDAGHPTSMTRVMNIMARLVFAPILTQIGIITMLVPVLLILFIPDLSKGAVVGIIIGLLVMLSSCLHTYSVYFGFLDVSGLSIAGQEVLSGKEVFGYLAAYAAVLFVFVRSVSGEGHLTVNFPPPKEASTSTRLSSDSGTPAKIK